MTEVYFSEHEDYRTIEINGHSGNDIVCAGISALSQAYLFFMEDLSDNGKALIDSHTEMSGYSYICSWNKSIESIAAYNMTKQGIEAISETYPENVKIFRKK